MSAAALAPPADPFERTDAGVIRAAELRALYNFWQERRGSRSQPDRASFLPEELKPWWPDLIIYDVVPFSAGPRYRFRLQGTRVVQSDGADFTGRYLDDVMPPPFRFGMLAAYHRAVNERAPVYTVRDSQDRAGRPVVFERLILPLGPDGAAPKQLLTGLLAHAYGAYFERYSIMRDVEQPPDFLVRAIIA